MQQITERCNIALHRPYNLHPALYRKVNNYANTAIAHTLFYGPGGAGKWSMAKKFVATHMGVSLPTMYRIQKHIHLVKDKEYYFFKSTVHFELDILNFLSTQHVFVAILNELSKTLNVALNRYKIIMVRNADALTLPTQHQLRMMMETMYTTTRIIFVVSNIDRIDDTLVSRMVCIRTASPSVTQLITFFDTYNYFTAFNTPHAKSNFIRSNNNNLSLLLLRSLLVGDNVIDEVTCISDKIWESLQRRNNPMDDLKKMMQHSNMMHVPWITIINKLFITRIIPRVIDEPLHMNTVLHLWQIFNYNYAREQRKEYAIELLIVKLSMVLKHKIWNVTLHADFLEWI